MLRTALPIAVTLLLWAGMSAVSAPSQTRERDPRTVVVQLRDRGFHWTDAGIGALATFGLIAAAAGATLVSKPVNDKQPEGKPPCPED